MIDSILSVFVPPHREGYRFIAAFALATVLLFWIAEPLGWIGVIATAWCVYFFRDPDRVTPLREGLVISPADGHVCAIETVPSPPELALDGERRIRVSVFMNVFDCHVNRAPVAGRIVDMTYVPGKFLNADLDKASEDNERHAMTLETAAGQRYGVVQIAGLVARRIVTFVKQGEPLGVGERYGLIRFGSRVDVYLPPGVHPHVAIGQKCVAGETVLADAASDEGPREARLG